MKRSNSLSLVFLAVGLLIFTGCASGPQVDPQVTAAVSAHNVPKETYDKIANARPLEYSDIVNLVSAKVPSHIIVGYLRSTQRIYNLTYAQLNALRRAGATPQVLNYLTETQGFYGTNTPKKTFSQKLQKDAYYNDKLNQDKQPFFYNAPIIDDWYDSSYEESMYSPFSFN